MNRIIYKVDRLFPYEPTNISTNELPPDGTECPPISIRKRALNNDWLIERKIYSSGSTKSGQIFWQFIKDHSKVAHLVNNPANAPVTSSPLKPNYPPKPQPKRRVIKNVSKIVKKNVKVLSERDFSKETYEKKSILDLLVPEQLPSVVPMFSANDEEIIKFVHSSYKYKAKFMKIEETKWKLLVRAALRGENTLIVGDKGEGKTITAIALSKSLGRPLFKINFGNMQDAQTALIGKTHFDTTKGTVFSKSYFVEAITTPNSIVLLDELSRSSDDAMNILFPVLDPMQRYLRLNDEVNSPIVEVAEGVCFVATANIGHEYTGTRILDAALKDRFSTKIEVDHLDSATRSKILKEAFPALTTNITDKISQIASNINAKVYAQDGADNISVPLSTRMCLACARLVNDGFTPLEAVQSTVYPEYSEEGGAQSERTFVAQIVQGVALEKIDRLYESQDWGSKEVEETITEEVEEWVD